MSLTLSFKRSTKLWGDSPSSDPDFLIKIFFFCSNVNLRQLDQKYANIQQLCQIELSCTEKVILKQTEKFPLLEKISLTKALTNLQTLRNYDFSDADIRYFG